MTPDDVRREFAHWLDQQWNPDDTIAVWWEKLAAAGWAAPSWPREWFGRGVDRAAAAVVSRVLRERQLPGPAGGVGTLMAGPTILTHGTDEQRGRFLWPILTGQMHWCQLFSEPNAGSDLASVSTRARTVDDGFLVSGQKVWTSSGHLADWGMLLARADESTGPAGLGWFAIQMDQPGVTVRPLREMTGRSLFNEVFLDEAFVHRDDCVGGIGHGWHVARTTLHHERAGLGSDGAGAAGLRAGRLGGQLELRAGDVAVRISTHARVLTGTGMALSGKCFAPLLATARRCEATALPAVRQQLARLFTLESLGRFEAAMRRSPTAAESLSKLRYSQLVRLARDAGLSMLGAAGMLQGASAPDGGLLAEFATFAPSVSIYGGSDQIQRNIVAERGLGLPRHPG
jgi:alkylation response protein AidB-like acyl-CoA dehydrogenase